MFVCKSITGFKQQHRVSWKLIKSDLTVIMDSVSHVCHMCAEVWRSRRDVWSLELSTSHVYFLQGGNQSESSVVEDVCGGKGMRHRISAWESVPASSLWAAETPPEGHDTRRPLSPHQAFHMNQPSLTSPPGWRRKRKHKLYCLSSCSTSPQVGSCFSFLSLCLWT